MIRIVQVVQFTCNLPECKKTETYTVQVPAKGPMPDPLLPEGWETMGGEHSQFCCFDHCLQWCSRGIATMQDNGALETNSEGVLDIVDEGLASEAMKKVREGDARARTLGEQLLERNAAGTP